MTTITHKDILSYDTKRYAMFFRAYKECSDEIRLIIDKMMDIICDETSDEDERDQAVDVVVEALFPSLNVEVAELNKMINSAQESIDARMELDAEECTFAERLKSLLEEKNWTQEKLAALTGVSQPAIANMLNRSCRPQRKTIARFAEVFGVEPKDLWPE